ncbi:MAG: hypothetical protein B7X04_01775 [Parcubacteria group bacterium 21-54-25]|nr:MAG: hypothetical protein B7X04_01775 [Parcubacteria group bacterium 21-54-25]HQU07695.1 PilN domain-containing protein [Candidatus Paceibacterota bacterium]
MPIPSGVPTSFVPRPPTHTPQRRARFDLAGAVAFAATLFFVVALVVTGGLFLYGQYLTSQLASKQTTLQETQHALDQTTVTQFSYVSNQLATAQTLLSQHSTFSRLFDLLEKTTVQNIQITSLSLTTQKDNTATLDAQGVARDFNALVSESQALMQNTDLTNVIFSDITPNSQKSTEINFSVSATVNQSIVDNFAAVANPTTASSTGAAATSTAATATSTTP